MAGTGELRRIQHNQAEAFSGLGPSVQILKNLSALEADVGNPVKIGVRAS
jgi:hypothetical protein